MLAVNGPRKDQTIGRWYFSSLSEIQIQANFNLISVHVKNNKKFGVCIDWLSRCYLSNNCSTSFVINGIFIETISIHMSGIPGAIYFRLLVIRSNTLIPFLISFFVEYNFLFSIWRSVCFLCARFFGNFHCKEWNLLRDFLEKYKKSILYSVVCLNESHQSGITIYWNSNDIISGNSLVVNEYWIATCRWTFNQQTIYTKSMGGRKSTKRKKALF